MVITSTPMSNPISYPHKAATTIPTTPIKPVIPTMLLAAAELEEAVGEGAEPLDVCDALGAVFDALGELPDGVVLVPVAFEQVTSAAILKLSLKVTSAHCR